MNAFSLSGQSVSSLSFSHSCQPAELQDKFPPLLHLFQVRLHLFLIKPLILQRSFFFCIFMFCFPLQVSGILSQRQPPDRGASLPDTEDGGTEPGSVCDLPSSHHLQMFQLCEQLKQQQKVKEALVSFSSDCCFTIENYSVSGSFVFCVFFGVSHSFQSKS